MTVGSLSRFSGLTGWLWVLLSLGVVLAGPVVIWRLDLAMTIFRGLLTWHVCAFCQWKPGLGLFLVTSPCGLGVSQNVSWLQEGVFQACGSLRSGSSSLHCILLMVVIHGASSAKGRGSRLHLSGEQWQSTGRHL